MTHSTKPHNGFTLIELLVVIAIIGLLIGLLFPTLLYTREASQQTACTNHIKELALASHNYQVIHEELPAESYFNGTIFADDKIDKAHVSFRARLLPFIEQTALWNKLHSKPDKIEDFTDEHGSLEDLALHAIPIFFCPSNPRHLVDIGCTDGQNRHASHYYGVAGAIGFHPAGKFYSVDPLQKNAVVETPRGQVVLGPFANTGTIIIGGKVTFASITDGLSNTFLLGEISWADYGAHYNWMRGTVISNADNPITALASSKGIAKNFPINAGKENETLKIVLDESGTEYDVPVRGRRAGHGISGFGSDHVGGANFAFADGSVRFFSETTDTTVLMHLSTRNGGESASP